MKTVLKTVLGLLIAGGVVVALLFAYREMSREREQEQAREKPVAAPTRVRHGPEGEIILTLDAETQKRIGLVAVPLSAAEHRASRHGFARVLDATPLTPLLNGLALARTNLAASDKEFARAKVLAAQTNVSEKALLAAENAAQKDRLAVEAAEDRLTLAFGRELAGRADLPELARLLATLEAALVRVDLPAGEALGTPPARAHLYLPGREAEGFEAEFLGPATSVEPEFQGQGFFYLARQTSRGLVPGANLSAVLDLPGDPSAGVAIPRGAVVRSEGRGWLFVQTGEESFTRREVALTRPTGDGWFVTQGFKPGEKVVVTGAQVLQSELGKAGIRLME